MHITSFVSKGIYFTQGRLYARSASHFEPEPIKRLLTLARPQSVLLQKVRNKNREDKGGFPPFW